jgi:formamidopyrimidine-DNA glycosylase
VPELPEVETVRRGLSPVMEGQVILAADVRRPDLRWPLPERMAERLTGQRVERLRRRSKYILADLSSGETLIVHLGMSGRMLVSGAMLGEFHHHHPAPEKHDHVVLDMEGGARITFNDARRFGRWTSWPTERVEAHWLLAGLGPEPLGNAFDEDYLVGPPARAEHAGQGGAPRPADRRGARQHLRVRGAPPRRDLAPSQGRPHRRAAGARHGAAHPAGAGRGDRGGRIVAARLPAGRRRTGLLPAHVPRLRPGGRALRRARLSGTVGRIVQSGRSSFFCAVCQR